MSRLLRFDPSAAFLPKTGIKASDVASIGPQLERLRDEVCEIDVKMLAGEIAIPSDKQPLDAGFYLLPERLLAEYQGDRQGSELARILSTTKQIMSEVDRVVVIGHSDVCLGARSLMDACCQPFFNELSRGGRGSRPRIYFGGDRLDSDASQGLLHLLGAHRNREASGVDDSWGIVVIGHRGGGPETESAFRHYLKALEASCGHDLERVRSRLIPVLGDSDSLGCFVNEVGGKDRFLIPAGVSGRFSVLSAVGLIPAALMGINVMKLLEGAKAINEHFRTTRTPENIVLQYAAVNHLMETKRGACSRMLSVWSKAMESAGAWYEHLLTESLGGSMQVGMPVTNVSTRDRCVKHQLLCGGRRDGIVNNVIVENPRFDPLSIDDRDVCSNADCGFAGMTWGEAALAVIEATNQALRDEGRPCTNLCLPLADEFHLGQYFQMMMLATVVEGRLLGMNPYGQSGGS